MDNEPRVKATFCRLNAVASLTALVIMHVQKARLETRLAVSLTKGGFGRFE
jgi:hypothetical protein